MNSSNQPKHPLLHPPPLPSVNFDMAGFWGQRRLVNRWQTIPSQYEQLKSSGRLEALRPDYQGKRHRFWDSDVAKWLEAAWCELASGGMDDELQSRAQAVQTAFCAVQEADGYCQSQIRYEEPERRWQDLCNGHELYSMGHLLEAFCAEAEGGLGQTGLAAAERLVDCLWAAAGPQGRPMYCGHPEIELALMRYHRLTGRKRAWELARLMIDRRGGQPHIFDAEVARRGLDLKNFWAWKFTGGWHYFQAHAPVREQTQAIGHAVRAVYLYCGMTDLWAAGDNTLGRPLQRLWDNLTERRMYVTGGIGSTSEGERLTHDFDLPDNRSYCETCAAIGLARWARRMLGVELTGRVGDVMELALHNAMLAGLALDGRRYFYGNPLASHPHDQRGVEEVAAERQPWFGCACCPPNVARTISQLAEFAYASGGDWAAVHLYIPGRATLACAEGLLDVSVETTLPWGGETQLTISAPQPLEATLALRIPAWAEAWTARLDGRSLGSEDVSNGYLQIRRRWDQPASLELSFSIEPRVLFAHPAVRSVTGQICLARGPLVYCLEEIDNGPHLDDLRWTLGGPVAVEPLQWGPDGVALRTMGCRGTPETWQGALYRRQPPAWLSVPLLFVPYARWGNRGPGEMRVWTRYLT